MPPPLLLVVRSVLMAAVVSHATLFYRKQLALQLPVADGVDWNEVLIRLHEGSMDKVQLDQIKHEVRNVGGSFVHLLSKNVRIDDDLTL